MKRKCAHTGTPPLTCRSEIEIVAVLRVNDLSALMLTLGAADFSRRTKVSRKRRRGDTPPYHSQNGTDYTTTSLQKEPPAQNRRGAADAMHPANQSSSTNYLVVFLAGMTLRHRPEQSSTIKCLDGLYNHQCHQPNEPSTKTGNTKAIQESDFPLVLVLRTFTNRHILYFQALTFGLHIE